MKKIVLIVGIAIASTITGILISNAPVFHPNSTKVTLVTTVAPLKNIAQNIAGPYATVIGLIPDGTDSHTYEPTPSNAKDLANADLIVVNGLSLEEPTLKLAQANKKKTTNIVELGDQTIDEKDFIYDFSFPKEKGSPNPHLWMNPLYALKYAEIFKNELSKIDQSHKIEYEKRFLLFKDRIEILDTAIKTATATIPEKNKKLLTYHDSFAYFAPRYGMTVIGAIQPSSFKEPSAAEITIIVKQIKDAGVPAIFGSEVYESSIVETIGTESGATYIDTLRDDDLPGQPATSEHSYINMMVTNVLTMTKALGGDPVALKGVDVKNIE